MLTRPAFFKALDALSSPLPSVQLRRLKLLYSDIRDALSSLFPLNHPSILALSSPLAPTTSPLHSTAILLKDILVSLKQRCAPARDREIDEQMILLEEIPPPLMTMDSGASPTQNHSVARSVIGAIQSILTIAEVMKEDLNKFVLRTMNEAQLKSVVQQQAKTRERELVLRLWSVPEGQGLHIVREKWRAWVEQLEDGLPLVNSHQEDRWKRRLLQALQSSAPVSCNDLPGSILMPTPANVLPPQFLFVMPNLLSIQNYIQALTITAALRSLLRVPMYPESDQSRASIVSRFVQRVWTLLAGEIEADEAMSRPADLGDTKTAHLADELVHARRMLSDVGTDEEARLRAATERILKPQDPVYVLLQRRALVALRESLITRHPPTPVDRERLLPEKLRTGKDVATGVGKVPKVGFWPNAVANGAGAVKAKVYPKGFEDSVLANEVDRLSSKFTSCIAWVEDVWGDLTTS